MRIKKKMDDEWYCEKCNGTTYQLCNCEAVRICPLCNYDARQDNNCNCDPDQWKDFHKDCPAEAKLRKFALLTQRRTTPSVHIEETRASEDEHVSYGELMLLFHEKHYWIITKQLHDVFSFRVSTSTRNYWIKDNCESARRPHPDELALLRKKCNLKSVMTNVVVISISDSIKLLKHYGEEVPAVFEHITGERSFGRTCILSEIDTLPKTHIVVPIPTAPAKEVVASPVTVPDAPIKVQQRVQGPPRFKSKILYEDQRLNLRTEELFKKYPGLVQNHYLEQVRIVQSHMKTQFPPNPTQGPSPRPEHCFLCMQHVALKPESKGAMLFGIYNTGKLPWKSSFPCQYNDVTQSDDYVFPLVCETCEKLCNTGNYVNFAGVSFLVDTKIPLSASRMVLLSVKIPTPEKITEAITPLPQSPTLTQTPVPEVSPGPRKIVLTISRPHSRIASLSSPYPSEDSELSPKSFISSDGTPSPAQDDQSFEVSEPVLKRKGRVLLSSSESEQESEKESEPKRVKIAKARRLRNSDFAHLKCRGVCTNVEKLRFFSSNFELKVSLDRSFYLYTVPPLIDSDRRLQFLKTARKKGAIEAGPRLTAILVHVIKHTNKGGLNLNSEKLQQLRSQIEQSLGKPNIAALKAILSQFTLKCTVDAERNLEFICISLIRARAFRLYRNEERSFKASKIQELFDGVDLPDHLRQNKLGSQFDVYFHFMKQSPVLFSLLLNIPSQELVELVHLCLRYLTSTPNPDRRNRGRSSILDFITPASRHLYVVDAMELFNNTLKNNEVKTV